MNQARTRRNWIIAGLLLFLCLFIAIPISLAIRTSQAMRQTEAFLRVSHNEQELLNAYHSSSQHYQSYQEMPVYYQRGMQAFTNCEFRVFQREGMPYWLFIVAIHPQSRMIEHGIVRKLGS